MTKKIYRKNWQSISKQYAPPVFCLWKNISHIVEKAFPNNVVNGITRVGKLRKKRNVGSKYNYMADKR